MAWQPDYITLPVLRNYLEIGSTADDTELSLWITAASRAVDRYCSGAVARQFGKADSPVTRVYRRPMFYDPDLCLWVLEMDDLQDTTGLTVNGTAYAGSGTTLLPDNAPADGLPYTQLGFTSSPYAQLGFGFGSAPPTPVSLVGSWGWSAVPAQVQGAVRLQCSRWNFRRRSPAGIAGSPESGSETRLLARLDPDVATVLIGLTRRAGAA